MRLSAVSGHRFVKPLALQALAFLSGMTSSVTKRARSVLGYGLQIQTAVTTYRIHVPNQRVSLTMETSSIGTVSFAAAEIEKYSFQGLQGGEQGDERFVSSSYYILEKSYQSSVVSTLGEHRLAEFDLSRLQTS